MQLCSWITLLKAGISCPEYFYSFKRQVYVDHVDVKKILDFFVVSTNDLSYQIFTIMDKLNCFLCKEEEHIAKQCFQNNENNALLNSTNYPHSLLKSNYPSRQMSLSINKKSTDLTMQIDSIIHIDQDIHINQN